MTQQEPYAAYIGIDVSKATLDVAVRPTGQRLSVPNQESAVSELVASLGDPSQALVVLEATGGLESVLNQIRLAVEALMYPTFWVPLSQCAGRDKGYKSEWLRGLMSDLGEKHPSLKHYRQMLMDGGLKELLKLQAPYNQDLSFVYEKLPASLKRLNEQRNQAEHDPTRVWERQEVATLFNEFLGIGCDGVLPRLAKLYLKVKEMTARREKLAASGGNSAG